MTQLCPHHENGDEACAVQFGYKAAEVVVNARTDKEAQHLAVEAMRQMLEMTQGRKRAKSFAGILTAPVKGMP